MKMAASKAFTIVELLIVIVVIAILAAISIVAYNGIQDRARLSSAKAYQAQLLRSPDVLKATAMYNFDDCSGSTVRDSSEPTNNGTIVGTVSWSSDTPSGSGCSLYLNGSSRVDTAARIDASYYIKAAWVKITNCSPSNNIISGQGSAFYSCTLRAGHNGSWSSANGGNVLNDGKWHYVSLLYSDSTLKMHVDGKLVATSGSISAPSDLTNQIGALSGGNNFTGYIDDVLIIAGRGLD